jgi:peroxiredoxin
MTSKTTAHRAEAERREHLNSVRRQQDHAQQRRRLLVRGGWTAAAVLIVMAVAAMMLTSRPTSTSATRTAPDFTLTSTAGTTVRLADYRGKNVLLYFSEGAGCGSCITQMAAIEKSKTAFDAAGITVLPIVMNTRAQITADLQQNGVTTPFLLDDGTVSKAYGTLGKGMHADLPGHSFVLIDKSGEQRWHGEYPSMWLAPTDLLTQVTQHLQS